MRSISWWKWLSALLILMTLIVGLITPLAPGIPRVSPERINNGVTSVTVTGYNTHFQEAESSLQAWITNGGVVFCPYEMAVVSETEMRLTFSVAQPVGRAFFDLYVNNDIDGTMRLPNAFMQNGLEVVQDPPGNEPCLETIAVHQATNYNFPNQPILNETIRNILYHVPGWFAMLMIMTLSLVFSVMHLRSGKAKFDLMAGDAAHVGLLFSFVGLATGSVWARFTWGAWWVSDPRLNGAALGVLVYLAYFVLKSSVNDREKAARLGAVYNIFAYAMMILFVMILPRMTASLHPGVGGNPAFSQYDLDDNLRLMFYPAVLGWMGLALWIFQVKHRIHRLKHAQIMRDES